MRIRHTGRERREYSDPITPDAPNGVHRSPGLAPETSGIMFLVTCQRYWLDDEELAASGILGVYPDRALAEAWIEHDRRTGDEELVDIGRSEYEIEELTLVTSLPYDSQRG